SSVCPRCRPKPLTSLTVIPCTPTSFKALRTSSRRNGLMIAVTSFIREDPAPEDGPYSRVCRSSFHPPRGRSEHHGTAVHHDRLAGHQAAAVAGEKQHRADDVPGLEPAADRLLGNGDLEGPVQLFPEHL